MSIVIKNLNLKRSERDTYTFRDLNVKQQKLKNSDMFLSDFGSIQNAIYNIFNIKRGSRILDPEFGSDLDEFLFEPVSTSRARDLGEAVEEMLKQEPRILSNNINVEVDGANNRYVVDINYIIPSLTNQKYKTSMSLSGDTGITLL